MLPDGGDLLLGEDAGEEQPALKVEDELLFVCHPVFPVPIGRRLGKSPHRGLLQCECLLPTGSVDDDDGAGALVDPVVRVDLDTVEIDPRWQRAGIPLAIPAVGMAAAGLHTLVYGPDPTAAQVE